MPEQSTDPKRPSRLSLAVDFGLSLIFFVLIYSLAAPHVPSTNQKMTLLWGMLTASCMTAVFWLCIQMFRLVLRAQRARDARAGTSASG